MLGTFPFGLAVCSKFEGRGRGNGSVSGRIGCVPETIADGGSGMLKSPSFGLSGCRRSSSAMPWAGSSRGGGPDVAGRGKRFIKRWLCGWQHLANDAIGP